MKRQSKYLGLATIVAIIPILFFMGNYRARLEKKSYNFQRNLVKAVKSISSIDVTYNSYYIGGYFDHNLYLSSSTSPNRILSIDMASKDKKELQIQIDEKDFKTEGYYQTRIDSNHFYMSNGISRSVLIGLVNDWNAKPYAAFTPYFLQNIPLRSSMVYQYVSARTNENSLRKEYLNGKRIENDSIFEKQVDGLYCTSGTLTYCDKLKQLIYLYTYRNEILIIDTNLNLIKKLRTIDPVSKAKFKVSTIKSNNSKVIVSPSLVVNAGCSVWDRFLYVNSKLMGGNEDDVKFNDSTVVDVYDLLDHKYLYSFYLPKQTNLPVKQIFVKGNRLFTLSGHLVSEYILAPQPFS